MTCQRGLANQAAGRRMNTTVLAGSGYRWDVDGCVWCQPSSGSETTCERPNQAAQVVRGSNAGGAVQVWGPLSAAIQASPGRAQRGPGLGAGAQAAGWP